MNIINRLYEYYKESSVVCTDTRNIKQGCLFFCLSGEHFDGNTFAKEALEKGAKYVVVDNPKYKINDSCVSVSNTLETLQQLAIVHRSHLQIPIIGITGTNGKTTTKELVCAVLSKKYSVNATVGNFNNHIGVPLTILSINPNNTDIAIVEMGANHVGEIAFLCEMTQPTMGIITNIGKAHLEGFGSVEGIIKTKSALYESIRESDGILFVNANDKLLMKLSQNMERITYGKTGLYKGIPLEDNLLLKLYLPDYDVKIQTQLIGNYNFPNAMAAIAVGLNWGVPVEMIKSALEAYIPENKRSQLLKKGDRTIIVDAYNANPSSMKLAIENIAKMKAENKVLLLGNMAELGIESTKEHQEIIDLIRSFSFTSVFLFGEEFLKTNADESWIYTDSEMLKEHLKLIPQSATILVKGSRFTKMEQFVEIVNK